ncbi:DUF4145 domain-containing protein [Pantoea agglomerans]|uniref:DUF4145 domain-containing protein n=1 Tax=Enterobacter agglomerans TaxID=549 RepID=UPI00289A3AC2|nr:DUF4145 domain-containing protein [Pantoea agglomerans]WNK42636.1 DUF4145 domain-containing protein [Pantoea agglomerans]
MNQSLLTCFTKHQSPAWSCPSCHSTSLAIMPDTFHSGAVPETVARFQQADGGLEDIRLVFSCLLKCERARCGAVVAVSGTGEVRPAHDEDEEEDGNPHFSLFQAKCFIPALSVFNIPEQCPDAVAEPLKQSFALFPGAPGAAANAVRIALEQLMDALEIPPRGSLHRRIEALPAPYSMQREALMAIKFLGNAGSHEFGSVTTLDIEHAFVITEFVLQKIYAGSTQSVRQLINRLTVQFGPDSMPNSELRNG